VVRVRIFIDQVPTHAPRGGSKRVFGQLDLPVAALAEAAGSPAHRYLFIMQFPIILSNELLELVPGSAAAQVAKAAQIRDAAIISSHLRLSPAGRGGSKFGTSVMNKVHVHTVHAFSTR
jgi:hypothetical protein